VVRPLLDIGRQEILEYLQARSIPFREDPSNEEMSYKRNRIRHQLLPVMTGFNRGARDLLHRTARICMEEDDFLQGHADALWNEMVELGEGIVDIPAHGYRGLHPAMRRRLLIKAYEEVRGECGGLAFRHVEAMDRLASEQGGERWLHLPGGVRLVVGGGRIILGSSEALAPGCLYRPVAFPGETPVPEARLSIRWEVLEGTTGWPRSAQGGSVCMDLDALRGGLLLRGPRPGDRLRPKGLKGTRKVQDILVDRKIPRRLRWRVPLLVDEAGVVWVVGNELDQRVRLRPETRRILIATVIPEGGTRAE
jgi:tRNA(Ile)-lysidine synthase